MGRHIAFSTVVSVGSLVLLHAAEAQQPNSNVPPAILGIFGNIINQAQQAQMEQQRQAAAAAWSATDPRIVSCMQYNYHYSIPQLVQSAVPPSDPRIAPTVNLCAQAIAAQQVQQQQQLQAQQRAQAEAQRAAIERQQAARAAVAQAQADADARAAVAAQKAAEAEQEKEAAEKAAADEAEKEKAAQIAAQKADEAQREQVTALFTDFQTKAIVADDPQAELLNYSTFGTDKGAALSFWALKEKGGTTYALFKKGSTLQEPVQTLKVIDLAKLDPGKFFIAQQLDAVTITSDGTVLASCESCDKKVLESRWFNFFSQRK